MAEYFNNKKLGTCEHLMDVSRDQIINRYHLYPNEVNQNGGNLVSLKNYLDLSCNYVYRFPYKEELNSNWNEETKNVDFSFSVDTNFLDIPHSEIIQTEINGQFYNLPFCPASKKAEELGVKKINHWGVTISIYGERFNNDNPNGYTLFQCTKCNEIFSLDRNEAIYIRQLLKDRGAIYESSHINYKNGEELVNKAVQLCEYVNKINRDGSEYLFEQILDFIKNQEDEQNMDLTLDELKLIF